MSLQVPSPLVSIDWLHQYLGNEQLVILFSSLKKVGVVGESSDSNNFIPNAVEFDIKMDFSDRNAEFPNTFPTVHQFESQASKLGITSDSCIVVMITMESILQLGFGGCLERWAVTILPC